MGLGGGARHAVRARGRSVLRDIAARIGLKTLVAISTSLIEAAIAIWFVKSDSDCVNTNNGAASKSRNLQVLLETVREFCRVSDHDDDDFTAR